MLDQMEAFSSIYVSSAGKLSEGDPIDKLVEAEQV